jgi:hypothetical protein
MLGRRKEGTHNVSSYHQMGHHSNNLIDLPAMSTFAGAIFSPINSPEEEVAEQVRISRESRGNFECILDPQRYVPSTERGKLKEWSYYPKDVDSADLSSAAWWTDLNAKIAAVAKKLQADAVCSPVVIPRVFDDKYYARTTQTGSELVKHFKGGSEHTKVLQTALVNLPELADANRPLELASIVSGTEAERVYLIFVGTTEPRREMKDADELAGAMKLIQALEGNGVRVLVGFCSSDVLLWKTAGATSCASGKFFNLRRFTRQRFEEPTATGGGQLPYWFEEALLAFLRQGDLIRARRIPIISDANSRNPFSQEILNILDEAAKTRTKPTSWLAISWRQFLYWFSDVEGRLDRLEGSAESMLRTADANWSKLDATKTLFEERFNDGSWVRIWLNAIADFTATK